MARHFKKKALTWGIFHVAIGVHRGVHDIRTWLVNTERLREQASKHKLKKKKDKFWHFSSTFSHQLCVSEGERGQGGMKNRETDRPVVTTVTLSSFWVSFSLGDTMYVWFSWLKRVWWLRVCVPARADTEGGCLISSLWQDDNKWRDLSSHPSLYIGWSWACYARTRACCKTDLALCAVTLSRRVREE